MSMNYWNLPTFLNDGEMHQVWDIIDKALDRHGYCGMWEEGELSMRLYDENLKQDLDAYMEYEPEPNEVDHPFFHET
jgi:hypothetical protein